MIHKYIAGRQLWIFKPGYGSKKWGFDKFSAGSILITTPWLKFSYIPLVKPYKA